VLPRWGDITEKKRRRKGTVFGRYLVKHTVEETAVWGAKTTAWQGYPWKTV